MHNLPDQWMSGDSIPKIPDYFGEQKYFCLHPTSQNLRALNASRLVFPFPNTKIYILDKYIENVKYN